jgi:DNA polymerase-1
LLQAAHQDSILEKIEGPLLPVLVAMEMEGIAIQSAALGVIGDELQIQIDELVKSIHIHADRSFNVASPKQLGEILFDQLNLVDKAKKTKTGQYKTDEQTLSTLEGKHPIIAEILAYREATKLKSTYLDALPTHIVAETGRIHTHFHQLVAATGRLASSDPNLQNIPVRSEAGRKIRKAFIPRTGFTLLSCDYSQIELRVMAALSQDATMIEAFQNNVDIHTITAAKVFAVESAAVTTAMRRTAKMVNFGIIYGISAHGLAQRLEIDRYDASRFIDAYFARYPKVLKYQDDLLSKCRNTGYVSTILGRRRRIDGIRDRSTFQQRNQPEREAINMEIQGSAADLIKLAMIGVDQALSENNLEAKLLLQIHDELVIECPKAEIDAVKKLLITEMSFKPRKMLNLKVPITIEVSAGPNWLAQEEIK